MTVVAFLTHPIGERDDNYFSRRGDNLETATAWFRYLKQITRWAICHPCMSYIVSVDENFFRSSMLTDVIEIMCRCDVVVVVGSHMSGHMRIEIDHARGRIDGPIPVIDLLDLGVLPPAGIGDDAHANRVRLEILRRADAVGL